MSHNILLVPIGSRVGLSTVSLGVIRALERVSVRVNFFKPVSQYSASESTTDSSVAFLMQHAPKKPTAPIALSRAERLISQGNMEQLLEELIEKLGQCSEPNSVLIMEGLAPSERLPWANRLNIEIAKATQADVVFIAAPALDSDAELLEKVEIFYNNQGGGRNAHLAGVILNKVGAPLDNRGQNPVNEFVVSSQVRSARKVQSSVDSTMQLFQNSCVPLLGCIPWNSELSIPSVSDVATGLNATYINKGDSERRRVRGIALCDHSVGESLAQLKPGYLVVTSADRADVIIAASLAVMNGVELGGILLTSGARPPEELLAFCESALKAGLPMIMVHMNSWQTAIKLQNLDLDFPVDNLRQASAIQDYAASALDQTWVDALAKNKVDENLFSPPAFRYKLTQLASNAVKRIILPEGDEPRTLKAAVICSERKIANIILLGAPDVIHASASRLGLVLSKDIVIYDPKKYIETYVPILVEQRKHKGMTEVVAREQLQDNVMLATLMLHEGEVDGIVSGAVHTTANTIRPALQIIKTSPSTNLVSSIFFMLLPDQVVIYGDCAINPNPNAEELSEIAIQSAESAKAFGLEPRVALISYSTGASGAGAEVDKVREATALVKRKRPDILVDGPLQYDAAIDPAVAKDKAPLSTVAGRANVIIFPDLNTGNSTYKAVQRSAGVVSIGPMLQGLNKPVNDLSRGALVDDIVYTVALTAIQAAQKVTSGV